MTMFWLEFLTKRDDETINSWQPFTLAGDLFNLESFQELEVCETIPGSLSGTKIQVSQLCLLYDLQPQLHKWLLMFYVTFLAVRVIVLC